MTFGASFLAATFGKVSPKFRTVEQWAETYRKIIDAKPISEKTKANRRSVLSHILDDLGERTISAVRPHEIAAVAQRIARLHPQAAKRFLIEIKDFFTEAVNYGWLDRNPATPVKAPVVHVQRQRLTLEQWRLIHAWSAENQPPWVCRMLVLALVTAQRRSDLEEMQFDDVWDGHLHIVQVKTGERLALPVNLRLNAIGVSIAEAIEDCRSYAIAGDRLLRKHNGKSMVLASLSARFEEARIHALPAFKTGHPPSLHECRSLSERLYRAQGIDTRVLLGHKHQAMTDVYNDDRGLSAGQWKTLVI